MSYYDAGRPFAAKFPFYRGDCSYAGRIEQAEYEQRGCRKRGYGRKQTLRTPEQYGKRRYHALLCHETRYQRRHYAPISESQRTEDGRDESGGHGEDAVFRVCNDVQPQIEGLQQPNYDRRNENNGECSLQEVICFVPQQPDDVFGARHAVIGQLHHEGHGFPFEHRVFGQQRNDNAHKDTDEIESRHDQAAVFREKCRREEAVDRQFCRAAHERRQHDGHFAVPFGGQRTACHDAGHGAAESDQHRHDASAGEADLPEQFIHDERHTGHIPGVFQYGEEEEQSDDDGNKTENGADSVEDAVDDERAQDLVDVDSY